MGKPCAVCGANSISGYCFVHKPRKPMRTSYLHRSGRIAKQWRSAKELWFKKHPQGIFHCYYCKCLLKRGEVTLDHFLSRSRRPELRNELSNLVPCCSLCNVRKGSRSGDEYLEILREEASRLA